MAKQGDVSPPGGIDATVVLHDGFCRSTPTPEAFEVPAVNLNVRTARRDGPSSSFRGHTDTAYTWNTAPRSTVTHGYGSSAVTTKLVEQLVVASVSARVGVAVTAELTETTPPRATLVEVEAGYAAAVGSKTQALMFPTDSAYTSDADRRRSYEATPAYEAAPSTRRPYRAPVRRKTHGMQSVERERRRPRWGSAPSPAPAAGFF